MATIIQVIPPNGNDYEVELLADQLGHLQSLVDGYIEIIYIGGGEIAVVNEEGRIYNLEKNYPATLATGVTQTLYGTVVIMNERDFN